jgi:hypothetical protein
MAEARQKPSPEQLAGRARIAWVVCAAFMFLVGAGFAAAAWHDYQDYSVRTSPPGGRTTTVVVDEVTTGGHCASSSCAPEYTLTYVVDGVSHQTSIRDHLHPGDEVHAFKGSDGKWYVTEDPGFGNSRAAWVIWAAIASAAVVVGVVCLRSRMKVPKPTT